MFFSRTHLAELIGETEQLREGFEIVNKNPSLSLLSRLAMGRSMPLSLSFSLILSLKLSLTISALQ